MYFQRVSGIFVFVLSILIMSVSVFAVGGILTWTTDIDWDSGVYSNTSAELGNLRACWDSSKYCDWRYRKNIIINGSTSELIDYQVEIDITDKIYNNTGLVGSWHFTDGSVEDTSGNDNDGIKNGGVDCSVSGKFGEGCSFDGVDDYVELPEIIHGPDNTISMWIKPRVLGGVQQTLYGFCHDANSDCTGNDYEYYLFRVDASGQVGGGFLPVVGSRHLYFLTTATISEVDKWYHVVLTTSLSENDVAIYINGEKQSGAKTITGSGVQTFTYPPSIGAFHIQLGDNQVTKFNGTIDELKIYNRTLSAAEIQEQYNAGKARLDLQDLRFSWLNTTSNKEENISYWLESDNKVWVKVPKITASTVENTTVSMYYGNSVVDSMSNNDSFIFDFSDDFSINTLSTYIWSGGGSATYNAANERIDIITGNNVQKNMYKLLNLSSQGYFQISMRKNADYPTDNYQRFHIKQDNNNYYSFNFPGSGYGPTIVSKVIGGVSVDSDVGTIFIDSNKDYIIEGWYTNDYMQFDIDGVTSNFIETTNKIQINPTEFFLSNDQIDMYLYDISIRKSSLFVPTVLEIQKEEQKQNGIYTSNITATLDNIARVKAIWDYSISNVYKKEINISNTGVALTDYQINFTLSKEPEMNADYSDIYFLDASGNEIPFWIETYTVDNVTVWVKTNLAASTITTINLYYGNDNIESASNGRDVFIVWDDFDEGIEQWTEIDDNSLILIDRTIDKRLEFTLAGQTNERVYIDLGSDIGDFIMEFTMYVSTGTSNIMGVGVSDTLSWTSTWVDGVYGGVYTQRAGNQNFFPLNVRSNSNIYRDGVLDADFSGSTYYYTLKRNDLIYTGSIYNDVARTSLKTSGTLSYSLQNLRYIYAISNHYDDVGYISSSVGWVDDIRIRKYTASEPTITSISAPVTIKPIVEITADGANWITVLNNTNYITGGGIGVGKQLQYRVKYNTEQIISDLMLHDITLDYDILDGSVCKSYFVDDEYYLLEENVSAASGTCFTVNADNVTIDCDGYTINYSTGITGYGIKVLTGYDKITVKNCNIVQINSYLNSHAIYYSGSSDGVIENNTIITSAGNSDGIYLVASNSSLVANNSIIIGSSGAYGVSISDSRDNNLSNLNINSNSKDIFLDGSNDYTNYILDSIFDVNDVGFGVSSNMDLEVQWSFDFYVNDSLGNSFEDVEITAIQNNGVQSFLDITDVSGNIGTQILTGSVVNRTGIFYDDYVNYTIEASVFGYGLHTKKINITNSMNSYITMIPGDTCNSYCTNGTSSTCDASCDGINGCSFMDDTAKTVCDTKPISSWVRYDEDNIIQCCVSTELFPTYGLDVSYVGLNPLSMEVGTVADATISVRNRDNFDNTFTITLDSNSNLKYWSWFGAHRNDYLRTGMEVYFKPYEQKYINVQIIGGTEGCFKGARALKVNVTNSFGLSETEYIEVCNTRSKFGGSFKRSVPGLSTFGFVLILLLSGLLYSRKKGKL